MMSRHTHPVSAPTKDALGVLGTQIATARLARRWKASDLAERAGISVTTLRQVERGAPTVAIGVVFEVATLLDVPLFAPQRGTLKDVHARATDRLALLPQRIYDRVTPPDDNF